MPQARTPVPATDGVDESEKTFVARQPICDAQENIFGHEFLFRQNRRLSEPDTLNASAQLVVNVFNRFGLHQVLGAQIAFLPLAADALASDFLDLLPAEKLVLEIRAGDMPLPELIGYCRRLRAKNFHFSLSGFDYEPQTQPLYELASYASFDVEEEGDTAPILDRLATIKRYQVKPIACRLHSYRQFQALKAFPFALYKGNCLGGPESFSINRADPSTTRVMQLFNLVLNDGDIREIEDAFKHDVALCYSLLRYINSVGFGLPYKVESIRSAIMLLGHDFLWRWLSLLIFAGVDAHAGQRLLLNTALIRGRLTELSGRRTLSQREAGHLFVVGIFSLLDVLLGMPMDRALAHLNLPDEVTDALLHREGKYAPFLNLALAFEGNDLRGAEGLCHAIGTDLSTGSADHMAAMEWARRLA